MPEVRQYPYLSPEAMVLRRRDGIPPWSVHPCEVDSLADSRGPPAFDEALRDARELRAAIEAGA